MTSGCRRYVLSGILAFALLSLTPALAAELPAGQMTWALTSLRRLACSSPPRRQA